MFAAPDDYSSSLSGLSVTLRKANRIVNISFPIINDAIFERTENMFAEFRITSQIGSAQVILTSRVQINILDDDGVYKLI